MKPALAINRRIEYRLHGKLIWAGVVEQHEPDPLRPGGTAVHVRGDDRRRIVLVVRS